MSALIFEYTLMPPFHEKEIIRYCGAKTFNDEERRLFSECLENVGGSLMGRVCYREFPISRKNGAVCLPFLKGESRDLIKYLEDCGSVVIFAATVGTLIDRLIIKYTHISPAKAMMLQGIGTERVETLCDAFQEKIRKDAGHIKTRVSPGYGDIPLEFQKDIFSLLHPEKIGIYLGDTLIMTPSKSVTGFIGIKKTGE